MGLPVTRFFSTATQWMWCAVVAALLGSGLTGCGSLQIPAFDPSGERIFSGGPTRLAVPDCPLLGNSNPPAPAPGAPIPIGGVPVNIPATQPTCQPPFALPAPGFVPVVAQPAGTGCAPGVFVAPPSPIAIAPAAPPRVVPISYPAPADCAVGNCPMPPGPILKIMPGTLVAPVGSEVVLSASLCGPDGNFIMRQPLEWMLNPDGVGQIVQVGQETRNPITGLFSSTPNKVATNYAKAKTSSTAQTITRGTATPADDLKLGKGQSWISITSPTEGTTHVTVVAPKTGNWEQRKQTAAIYWVDARWILPTCEYVKAGQRHALTTRIVRANGAPVAGWIVRYEFLEGPDASFNGEGLKSIEVPTGADGTAAASLFPSSMESGITLVRAQIIRPQTARGDLPNMVVGQGLISTTWSAPGLIVRALGPETVGVDGLINYRVEVVNTGDSLAPKVQLSYTPPTGVQLLNSNPAGQPFGQRYAWDLGDIPPRGVAVIEVNCRAQRAAEGVRSTFAAQSADGLNAENSVSTRIFASQLAVRMTGPPTGTVGEKYSFVVEVQNTGNAPLTRVTLRDTFDAGLQHSENRPSPIVREIGTLEPGEMKPVQVSFIPTGTGNLCNRIDATSEEGHSGSARSCFNAVARTAPIGQPGAGGGNQAPPAELKVSGLDRVRVGELSTITIDITNTSQQPLRNLKATVELGQQLTVNRATAGNLGITANRAISWNIQELAPGAVKKLQVESKAIAPVNGRVGRVFLEVPGVVTQAADYLLNITPQPVQDPAAGAGAAPPTNPTITAPPRPSANNLKVILEDGSDPIRVGETQSYFMDVSNSGNTPDEDVTINLIIPKSLKNAKLIDSSGKITIQSTARGVQLQCQEPLAAGGSLPRIEVQFTVAEAGTAKLVAEVTSRLTTKAVIAEANTELVK